MPKAGPDKKLCGAKTPRGKSPTCENVAGKGTDHLGFGRCSRHGGKTESHNKAAKVEQAQAAVAFFGLPREVNPHQALLEELYRTAGHVKWLEDLIHAGEITREQSPTGKRRVIKLDQSTFAAGDQPSVWYDLYERERKHYKDIARECIKLGLEERRLQLDELLAREIVQVLKGAAEELGFGKHPELPKVMRKQLELAAQRAAIEPPALIAGEAA